MLELGGLFYLWRLYSASGVTFFIVSESSSPTGSKRFSRPQGWLIGIGVSNCHAVLPKLYEGNFIFYMYVYRKLFIVKTRTAGGYGSFVNFKTVNTTLYF